MSRINGSGSAVLPRPADWPLVNGQRPNGWDRIGKQKMEQRKKRHARELTDWSGGLVRVHFEPSCHAPGDPDGLGHCYSMFLDCEGGTDLMRLDDRRLPELARQNNLSLMRQMIAELRRVAAIYMDTADALKDKLLDRKPPEPLAPALEVKV